MAQTILVTGSNSGFGHLTVETLARQGHSVFAGMREIAEKNVSDAEELRTFAQQEHLTLHILSLVPSQPNLSEAPDWCRYRAFCPLSDNFQ